MPKGWPGGWPGRQTAAPSAPPTVLLHTQELTPVVWDEIAELVQLSERRLRGGYEEAKRRLTSSYQSLPIILVIMDNNW